MEFILGTDYIHREALRAELGISNPTLYRYIRILDEKAPDEFDYQIGTKQFTIFQANALRRVSRLFNAGFSKQQILEQLDGGIWDECNEHAS